MFLLRHQLREEKEKKKKEGGGGGEREKNQIAVRDSPSITNCPILHCLGKKKRKKKKKKEEKRSVGSEREYRSVLDSSDIHRAPRQGKKRGKKRRGKGRRKKKRVEELGRYGI